MPEDYVRSASQNSFAASRARAKRHAEFEQFEQELHQQVMALERELLARELARYDVAAEQIEVAGVTYHPVWAGAET